MTLRELVWASEGKQKEEWGRMSHLMALTYNLWRGEGASKSSCDFNPFSKIVQTPRISDPRLMALEDGLPVSVVQ